MRQDGEFKCFQKHADFHNATVFKLCWKLLHVRIFSIWRVCLQYFPRSLRRAFILNALGFCKYDFDSTRLMLWVALWCQHVTSYLLGFFFTRLWSYKRSVFLYMSLLALSRFTLSYNRENRKHFRIIPKALKSRCSEPCLFQHIFNSSVANATSNNMST